jgi:hypothetical protein
MSATAPPAWLTRLERTLADERTDDALAVTLVVLASVAGRDVELDEDEARAAARRATLLLSAGGDPARGLDLDGRAVRALAEDLDDPAARQALGRGLEDVRAQAAGLPHVSEALHALLAAPDIAWRAFACARLADELDEE